MSNDQFALVVGGLVNFATLLSLFAGFIWGYATMNATVKQVKSDVEDLKDVLSSRLRDLDRLDHIAGTLQPIVDGLEQTLRNGLLGRIGSLEREIEVMKAICQEHRRQTDREHQEMKAMKIG